MGEDTVEESTIGSLTLFETIQPSIKNDNLGEIDIERLSYLINIDDLLEEILNER